MTRFDLHVHTALSACAEDIMSPRQILSRARAAGLQVIALTDHNASAHLTPALELADEFGVKVIPGIEVTSREEVHLLALFAAPEALADFQTLVDASLPDEENVADMFGHQVVYNARDEIVDVDNRLRQVGTTLGLAQLVQEITERQGAVIPAHVFRNRYSLISQLGFIDPVGGFDALELQWRQWRREHHCRGDRLEGFPLLTGSDAHFLEDVGRAYMEIDETTADLRRIMQAL